MLKLAARLMVLLVALLMALVLAAPAFAKGGPDNSCLAAVFSDYRAPICPGIYHPPGR